MQPTGDGASEVVGWGHAAPTIIVRGSLPGGNQKARPRHASLAMQGAFQFLPAASIDYLLPEKQQAVAARHCAEHREQTQRQQETMRSQDEHERAFGVALGPAHQLIVQHEGFEHE